MFMRWKKFNWISGADYHVYRFCSVSCPVLSCLLDGKYTLPRLSTRRTMRPIVLYSTQLQTHTLNSYQKIGLNMIANDSTGRFFGRKPTSVTSESNVRIGESAMPWEGDSEGKVYKYQYHPHGDKSQPLRNAPSALNTVIVPDVTLPAVRICPPFIGQ